MGSTLPSQAKKRLEKGHRVMIFTVRGVILSEAKNPERFDCTDSARILWILHSRWSLRMTLCI